MMAASMNLGVIFRRARVQYAGSFFVRSIMVSYEEDYGG